MVPPPLVLINDSTDAKLASLFSIQGSVSSASETINLARMAGCKPDEVSKFFNRCRANVDATIHAACQKQKSALSAQQRLNITSTERQKSLTELTGLLDEQGGVRDAISTAHFINYAKQQRLSTVRCGIMRVIAATRHPAARNRLDTSTDVGQLLEQWFLQAFRDTHRTVVLAALQAMGSMRIGMAFPVKQLLYQTVVQASTDKNIRVAAAAQTLLGQWDWMQQQGQMQPIVMDAPQGVPPGGGQKPKPAGPPTVILQSKGKRPLDGHGEDSLSKKVRPSGTSYTQGQGMTPGSLAVLEAQASTAPVPPMGPAPHQHQYPYQPQQPPQPQPHQRAPVAYGTPQMQHQSHIHQWHQQALAAMQPRIRYYDPPPLAVTSPVAAACGEEGQAAAELQAMRISPGWLGAPPSPAALPPPGIQRLPDNIPFNPVDDNEDEDQNSAMWAAGVRLPQYVRPPRGRPTLGMI